MAQVPAHAAAGAGVLVDDGLVAREEILAHGVLGIEQDVQVRGVHVEVADHGVFGQGGKGGGQRRLAGAALARKHDDFTHGAPLRSGCRRPWPDRGRPGGSAG